MDKFMTYATDNIPQWVYILLSKSDLVIAYAIIKFRKTETEQWAMFAYNLIDYGLPACNWDFDDIRC